jgi:integrase
LKTALRHANERLAELKIEPLSEHISPHSLRRTYISLRAVLGDSPVAIAEAVGHTDPTFTLCVYAKATKRRERLTGSYLAEFEWATIYGPKRTNSLKSIVGVASNATMHGPDMA